MLQTITATHQEIETLEHEGASVFKPFCPLGLEEGAKWPTVQIDFYESKESSPAFIAARGAGKTLTGAGKTFTNVLTHGSNALIVGPRYTTQVRHILVEKYLEIIPREFIWAPAGARLYHESLHVITLKDLSTIKDDPGEPGAKLFFCSGDEPDTIEGFTVGTVHLDEAGRMHEDVYGLALGCCRDPRGPGQIIITCTPPFNRQHWVNVKWGNGKWSEVEGKHGRKITNPNPQFPAWNMVWTDNYLLPEHWREMLEGLDPNTPFGRQQMLGEPVDLAGLVYDEFDPDLHEKLMPREFVRVAGGIDRAALGGTTAIKTIGLMPSGRVYSFFEWGKQHADLYEDVAAAAFQLQKEYPSIIFHMDPHPQGEVEIATLRHMGLNVVRAAKKEYMDAGVRLIKRYLHKRADGMPGYYISPDCPRTIAEFQSWTYKQGREGIGGAMISYEDVERRGKDFLDAERYAMVGLLRSDAGPPREIIWTVRGRRIV